MTKSFKRDSNGRFRRQHNQWSLDNFNDGYIHKIHNRFMVYFPKHKRASRMGYIWRSIVAYEAYHNIEIKKGYDVHHKDRNRLNDSKENLILLTHKEHSDLHNPSVYATCVCKTCKNEFKIRAYRLKEKGANRGSYCSQECYKKRTESEETKKKRRESLKINRWSRRLDKCIKCNKTEYKHVGKGLCKKCYNHEWRKTNGK